MTRTVPLPEFRRDPAHWQAEAWQAGVIAITDGDAVVGAWLSPDELARYVEFRRGDRRVFRTADLPDDLVAAIEAARHPDAG